MRHRQHHLIFTHVASAATAAIAASLIAVGAPAASAAPRVINVSGVITAFTPATINVAAGEQVSICLTSPDTDHDLTISTISFKVAAPTGPAVCKTLTAPAKPGTHKFICSIPGHESAGMVGSLVVAAAGAPAPAATSAAAAPQVGQTDAGDRPSAGLSDVSPLVLGGVLLIVAMMSFLLGWRIAHKD